MHIEYARYIEEPISPYRQAIFSKLIRNISGGKICDLGSHAVGHYWALGYAEHVDDISFYDISAEALELQQKTMNALSPVTLEEDYKDTLAFLEQEKITSGAPEQTALDLHEKVNCIEKFDFLKDTPKTDFDWLIAIESLEIVKTADEYRRAFQTAHQLLKPETGKLLAVVVPYIAHNDNVESLCQSGLEGLLNPDLVETQAVLEQSGFNDFSVEEIRTNMENYPNAYFITAHR